MEKEFNGLGMHLGNLSLLSKAKTRSISPENFTGEKGKGGMSIDGLAAKNAVDLGQGWKISPYIYVASGETYVLADINDSGAIQHIWMTPYVNKKETYLRYSIIRIYWDDSTEPSVECPLGDFFASALNEPTQVNSLAVCVNPKNGFNCYWEMPFRKRCKITLTNLGDENLMLYYQIDYTLTEVAENAAYFHAQFRRRNPLPYKDVYTILDGVKGQGHYVGTYMTWGVNNSGWWGEGEIKIYIDGDKDFPTICGTGTEDYFCGAFSFYNKDNTDYVEYSTPYAGMPQIIRPEGVIRTQMRFGMYRWHIMDPIRFEEDIKITIQALGWRNDRKIPQYLPLMDDISSVAFWYQTLPHATFPKLPDRDYLQII